MIDNRVKKIVIVGGGTAGWMAASVLAKSIGYQLDIQLIESDDIGTVGVGEATIPPVQVFNQILGLDESDFMRQTQATIKLGIQFNNWGSLGESYYHAFGGIGIDLGMLDFHHYWLRSRQSGGKSSLWDYSLNAAASDTNRFAKMDKVGETRLKGLAYAYHFDASLFAKYLRTYSEKSGVVRTEGKVIQVNLDESDGFIKSVCLEDGRVISGDLFIDCSGFRALLIEEALKTGYEDWSHWLRCDRALAAPSGLIEPLTPYTQSTAHKAGWQWRIPLQNRTGNGNVYASDYMSDDEAASILLNNITGKAMAEPRLIRFTSGRRKKLWNKNCIALGLSGGFVEPLESTAIHMVQYALGKLIDMFPDKSFAQADIEEFNQQVIAEYENIRNFIILHYKVNNREDSQFWKDCRNLDIPSGLKRKIDLFKSSGRVFRYYDELFSEMAWLQVMIGQGIEPRSYHPLADSLTDEQVSEFLTNVKTIAGKACAVLPSHKDFISKYCAASKMQTIRK